MPKAHACACRLLAIATMALACLSARADPPSPELQHLLNEVVGNIKANAGENLTEKNCDYTALDIAKQALQKAGFTNMAAGPVVIGALENACKGALDVLGLGKIGTTYSFAKCVYDYYTTSKDAASLFTCLGIEVAGFAGGQLVEKLEVDPLTGALTGRVIDRIGDDLKEGGLSDAAAAAKERDLRAFARRMKEALTQVEKEARLKAASEQPDGITYTNFAYGCEVQISISFIKAKPPTRGDSYVNIAISISGCDCGANPRVGRAIESGSIWIHVPVRFAPDASGAPAWVPDFARQRMTVTSKCCGRAETTTTYGGPPPTDGPKPVTPVTPKKPETPPPPVETPPPETFETRCPECVSILWEIDHDKGQIDINEAIRKSAQEDLSRIDREVFDAKERIEQLEKFLRSKAKVTAEASDGSVRVEITADGRQKKTRTNADGTKTEEYSDPSDKSIVEARKKLEAEKKKVEKLQAERKSQRERYQRAADAIEKAKAELKADEARLEECERRCWRRSVGLPETPQVAVERVVNRSGNNPFDPANPTGTGGTSTGPSSCTTPQPRAETQTVPCPSGQAGSIVQTRTFSCVGTTWVAGAFVTTSNTCTGTQPAGCTAPQPPTETQTLSCPAGQAGSITQARSYSCVSGNWVAGAFQTVSNTCVAAPSGCATNFSSGNYSCSGACGISSTGLTVTSGSNTMTANPFGANSNAGFSCSGASAQTQSSNLIILGAPGHTCTLNASGLTSFGINCRNSGGGTCASSCSR